MLMMSDREIGVLSGLGLASPAVTSVPSLFSATRRCSTRPAPGGDACAVLVGGDHPMEHGSVPGRAARRLERDDPAHGRGGIVGQRL